MPNIASHDPWHNSLNNSVQILIQGPLVPKFKQYTNFLNSENLKFAIFASKNSSNWNEIAINVIKLWRIINFSHLFGEILRNLRSKKKSSNWSKIGTAYLECEHTLTNFCEFLLNSQKFYLKSYGRMRNEKTFVVSDKYQLMESRKRASE